MHLAELDFKEYGRFSEKPGSFTITTQDLPTSWPYLLTNKHISLRCDQHGIESLQINPPTGDFMLKKDKQLACSPVLLWISPKDYESIAFTNFFRPILKPNSSNQKPQKFSVTYKPWLIEYNICENDIECKTQIHIVEKSPAVRMCFTITNLSRHKKDLNLSMALNPHCWSNITAPWDVPHLYQKTIALENTKGAFVIKTFSPAGEIQQRQDYFVSTDMPDIQHRTVLAKDFIGNGTFYSPKLIWQPECLDNNTSLTNSCMPGIISASSKIQLESNQQYTFNTTIGYLGQDLDINNAEDLINKKYKYSQNNVSIKDISFHKEYIRNLCSQKTIETPDNLLNKYVNEFVPIQLDWISYLDRGWGSGLRGVRDCSQDFTALVEIQPNRVKQIILEVLSLQKNNGSFLRQYNVADRNGKHDEREYVDSGLWVWELVYDYLCYRQEFELLNLKLPNYKNDKHETVLEHIAKLFNYFIDPENLGPHGLCKIYNGDWNDSINKAGLEGKGESIMVSCHLVAAIEDYIKLLKKLKTFNQSEIELLDNNIVKFQNEKDKLSENLLKYAYNDSGFFNGVFTDAGQWIFSDTDPDGDSRINCPVNCFAIISGILKNKQAKSLISNLKDLRCDYGYKLFQPGLGKKYIDKLGRMGSGDLPEGFAENAAVYNHGSNGFLGRAAAVFGDGDLLYDTLKCMYPYDQEIHPVQIAKTPPYAIVNHWRTAEGVDGLGGDCFFTGSLSVGLRNIYEGLVGIKPDLDGIIIDPVIPASWQGLKAKFYINDIEFEIEIINKSSQGCQIKELYFNNKKISTYKPIKYRNVGFINYSKINNKSNNIKMFI